jgi:anaerobic magnesium-protoporphyrin IX monomethyl ester cyclase
MRVVLADLKGREGFVSKDTVAGGYGSRFRTFSRTTAWVHRFKSQYHFTPSVHMAYLAAIFADAGHEVLSTDQAPVDCDLAIVLSSLVDFRNETAWADTMRARGARVGFVGLTASKMPELFADHSDFILSGEPEEAAFRLAHGETMSGVCQSEPIANLDTLPFPRWDLVAQNHRSGIRMVARPIGGGFPLLSSRGCPEFCTYCPHRILAPYRFRSVLSIVEEIEQMCREYRRPYIIFRDPLFSESRERVMEFCKQVRHRDLHIRFECETRLDRLDDELLREMYGAGLRIISFGVESVSPEILKRVGRRPTPEAHQQHIIQKCREIGIATAGFFIIGLPTDDWHSVMATIDFAKDLGPTFAQFKLLTPYPGTPLWKQMAPRVTETDWEKFDGFTPVFEHPNLTAEQMKFLLGAAYTHFYMRPSYLANVMRIHNQHVRGWVGRLDARVAARINRWEAGLARQVAC